MVDVLFSGIPSGSYLLIRINVTFEFLKVIFSNGNLMIPGVLNPTPNSSNTTDNYDLV